MQFFPLPLRFPLTNVCLLRVVTPEVAARCISPDLAVTEADTGTGNSGAARAISPGRSSYARPQTTRLSP